MAVLVLFSIFDACGMEVVSIFPLLSAAVIVIVIDAVVPISCSDHSSSPGGGTV
jgi:chromate transport protein ChrA